MLDSSPVGKLYRRGIKKNILTRLYLLYLFLITRLTLHLCFAFSAGRDRLFQSATARRASQSAAVLHFCITPINQSDKVFNERQLEC